MAHVVGLQPHLLGVPPPPHVFIGPHAFPQSTTLPHPSEAEPHSTPMAVHDFGVHGVLPHLFGPPPPHTAGDEHDLQSSMPPHPSGSVPQFAFFDAHVAGAHPHRFARPAPPQVVPDARHSPQSIMCPHPSAIMPHSAPAWGHVMGVQPHFLDMPPPPHVSGLTQRPHSMVPPQLSET
jgi:hypothetical protein